MCAVADGEALSQCCNNVLIMHHFLSICTGQSSRAAVISSIASDICQKVTPFKVRHPTAV